MNSIKFKLVALICGLALSSLVITCVVFYYFVHKISIQQANEHIANETKLTAAKFKSIYDDIKNNVSIVSNTPPIQGIIRSKHNYDFDPIEDSTLNQWRHRLENIFTSIMKHNHNYFQMRLVGIENNGREIVRVNRERGQLKIVPNSKLQQKANEPYFKESLQLNKEEIYFSKITYNREHGKVTSEYISTLRVITPIYDKDKLFGFIIINIDYPQLINNVIAEISPNQSIIIINNDGSYYTYNAKDKNHYYYNSEDSINNIPNYITHIQKSMPNHGIYNDGTTYTYYIKPSTKKEQENNGKPTIALQINTYDLYSYTYSLQNTILALMLTLTLLKFFFGYLFACRLTAPLSSMTKQIENYETYSTKKLVLPVEKKDEIGRLAKAFNKIILQLQETVEIDDLTGLYRVNAFYAQILSVTRTLRRKDQYFIIGLIDIDKFKTINDTYGHNKGNEVLKAISTELKSVFRESDKIARLGGDEFAIFCLLRDENKDISWFYEKVERAIANANVLVKLDYEYTASAGAAMFDSDIINCVGDIKLQISVADKMMYKIKSLTKDLQKN